MRKLVILSFIIVCLCSQAQNNNYPQGYGQIVPMTVRIIDPTSGILIGRPKSPVQPPEVYLDGHSLYIVSSHADYTLVVEDTDETEVYQTSVPSSVSTVVLPSSLSGTYILKLETDTFVFEGEIEL